jgi:hypothetical protein
MTLALPDLQYTTSNNLQYKLSGCQAFALTTSPSCPVIENGASMISLYLVARSTIPSTMLRITLVVRTA